MRSRTKQRELRRAKGNASNTGREKPISYLNSENYADPTAYLAVMNIVGKERGIASTR